MTRATDGSTEFVAALEIGLNRHLRDVTARSSTPVNTEQVGAASMIMITEPVDVRYADPSRPALDFALPTAHFVAIEQAAGWVYGLTINPQLAAADLQSTVTVGREVERRLGATAWARVSDGLPVDAGVISRWVAGTDEEFQLARYTAGSANLRLTIERTGPPSPSERPRGKTAETYFVTVRLTDFSNQAAYQARVLDRARAAGMPVGSLRLSAFMRDSTAG